MPSTTPQPDLTTGATVVDSWQLMRAWRAAIYRAPHDELRGRTALLALLMADHVMKDRGWLAWPSQATLAELTGDGRDPRNVRRRLETLIEAGSITQHSVGSNGRSARYALTIPPRATSGSGDT